ncbi:unnamed protein product [Amoebophrya sp. A120]|nr:unnamed protein product [Amoebophrya sp. A120]|eukprot:GSA120T00025528001.1
MPTLCSRKKFAAVMVCLQQYCHAGQPQQKCRPLPNKSLPVQRAECCADGSDGETTGHSCASDLEEGAPPEESDNGWRMAVNGSGGGSASKSGAEPIAQESEALETLNRAVTPEKRNRLEIENSCRNEESVDLCRQQAGAERALAAKKRSDEKTQQVRVRHETLYNSQKNESTDIEAELKQQSEREEDAELGHSGYCPLNLDSKLPLLSSHAMAKRMLKLNGHEAKVWVSSRKTTDAERGIPYADENEQVSYRAMLRSRNKFYRLVELVCKACEFTFRFTFETDFAPDEVFKKKLFGLHDKEARVRYRADQHKFQEEVLLLSIEY